MVVTRELSLSTRGNGDVRDITAEVTRLVRESGLRSGIVTVFCPGSTGALTTIEYEDGVHRRPAAGAGRNRPAGPPVPPPHALGGR